MMWTKVTDALPPVERLFSQAVWATVLDEKTGERSVEQTVFIHKDAEDYGWIKSPEISGFLCEFEVPSAADVTEELKKKDNIRVTHWAYVETPIPTPAEDENAALAASGKEEK